MQSSKSIRTMLAEGHHRLSIGRCREVAALVLAHPRKVAQMIECLWDEDPGVANRAADALEKLSCERPAVLVPWKSSLLGLLAEVTQNKLRWHLALIVPRLALNPPECRRAA